jgi:hypothetical protein
MLNENIPSSLVILLESLEEHLPAIIAGVLRLRATSHPLAIGLRGAPVGMTGLWAVENIGLGVQITRKDRSPCHSWMLNGSATLPFVISTAAEWRLPIKSATDFVQSNAWYPPSGRRQNLTPLNNSLDSPTPWQYQKAHSATQSYVSP